MALSLSPTVDFYVFNGGLPLALTSKRSTVLDTFGKNVSKKTPRAFWAFRRLGYMQVHQKKMVRSSSEPSTCHSGLSKLLRFMGGTWSCISAAGHVYCCFKGFHQVWCIFLGSFSLGGGI
ncbi:uncharacterized protein [Aristolochia californica]|uniref:uncharacterized protein isoform X2 n=1 Tax=Aristolochia californica TaxID=171875 RepID=UPI0035D9D745